MERIDFLDLAKGFCIILVVVFHLMNYYHIEIPIADFFKAFRLPLYFFLSGLFFKTYAGLFDFLKRKTNKLLIPFLFWYLSFSVIVPTLLFFICGINLSGDTINHFSFKDTLFLFYTKETFPNAPIWFLLCLFEVNIIFYCILLLNRSIFDNLIFSLCLISLLCGVIGVILGLLEIRLPMYLDSSLTALPFFVFGYCINRYTKLMLSNKYDKYNTLFAIILFAIVLIFAKHYSLKYNYFPKFINALPVYPCGFMGTLGIVLVAKRIKNIWPLTYFGKYSIMILVTHCIIYRYFFAPIIERIGLNGIGAFSLNLILTLCSYFILIPFMIKYLPYVTAQKDVIHIENA